MTGKKEKSEASLYMLYSKAHKDCGQAQDLFVHQALEVGDLGFAVFFFKEFLFVAIIGSSIRRCREKVVMTSLGRLSQIWLLTRAMYTTLTILLYQNQILLFFDYYKVFPSLLGIERPSKSLHFQIFNFTFWRNFSNTKKARTFNGLQFIWNTTAPHMK